MTISRAAARNEDRRAGVDEVPVLEFAFVLSRGRRSRGLAALLTQANSGRQRQRRQQTGGTDVSRVWSVHLLLLLWPRQRKDEYCGAARQSHSLRPGRLHSADEQRAQPRRSRYKLAAVYRISYGASPQTRARIERPRHLAQVGIKSEEPPFDIACKDQPASCRQQAGDDRIFCRDGPFLLSGDRVKRIQVVGDLSARRRLDDNAAVYESPPFFRPLRKRRNVGAPLNAGIIDPTSLWAVSRVVPTAASAPVRAYKRRLALTRFIPSHEVAVLIDALDPIDRINVRPRSDEFARRPIQDPRKSAFVGMNQQLLYPPVALNVYKNAFISRIKVPTVIRNLLVVPLQLAGVGIERNYAIGVEIGSRAKTVVEIGGWISDAPVDQIQLRIE